MRDYTEDQVRLWFATLPENMQDKLLDRSANECTSVMSIAREIMHKEMV
jgi:hypothetical protein